jgi:hypothetical protein
VSAYRAFRTEAAGLSAIVFAESAGKARAATFLSACDAGFGVSFPDIAVTRAPEYDVMRTTSGDVPAMNRPLRLDLLATHPQDTPNGQDP